MNSYPALQQFRVEMASNGIVHLVFDAPNHSMNVFSNSAVSDLKIFVAWLRNANVRGCVIRSGKSSGFCAGTDLPEILATCDLIETASPEEREGVAFGQFFRFSRALRALETCGKPIAAAIGGLALGGGCELALATHHRVMTTASDSMIGLPEALVGLLPWAGGTQRLPRLIGLDAARSMLLEGSRMSASQALAGGVADEIAKPGDEVAAAERWILSDGDRKQPWDRPNWSAPDRAEVERDISAARKRCLAETRGHYPAPLAVLDCLEFGLPLSMDRALEQEIYAFSRLILRPEPRMMIGVQFKGRADFEKRQNNGTLPVSLPTILHTVNKNLDAAIEIAQRDGATAVAIAAAIKIAGFSKHVVLLDAKNEEVAETAEELPPAPVDVFPGYWFEDMLPDKQTRLAAFLLTSSVKNLTSLVGPTDQADQRVIDYAACIKIGFPSYVGGPLSFAAYLANNGLHHR